MGFDLNDLSAIRARLGVSRNQPVSDFDLDPDYQRPPATRAAAVLVPLVARPGRPTVLLTRRAEHLRNHSGQVSFPGGRVEPTDASAAAAALREAQEEIGLDARFVDIIGELDIYETGTGFRITPVVGIVQPGFDLVRDPNEVDEIFETPLDFVLDPANHQIHSRDWNGYTRHYYAIPWGEHYIWGATAGMLVNFHRRLMLADPAAAE